MSTRSQKLTSVREKIKRRYRVDRLYSLGCLNHEGNVMCWYSCGRKDKRSYIIVETDFTNILSIKHD